MVKLNFSDKKKGFTPLNLNQMYKIRGKGGILLNKTNESIAENKDDHEGPGPIDDPIIWEN